MDEATQTLPGEVGRFDGQVEAMLRRDEALRLIAAANEYANLANHQLTRAKELAHVEPRVSGRYLRAGQATRKLSVALAEQARKMAA